MGIINVTPDSFYAASRAADAATAIDRAREMLAAGCDIIDIGGESTRPGAHDVSEAEELARVMPVVEALAGEAVVSIDTRKAAVATAAVAAGARIINDVGGQLARVAGECGAGYVAMHARGTPATMQDNPEYDDVVADVLESLEALAQSARTHGVVDLWLDPGIGFGKTTAHNLTLLRHLPAVVDLAHRYGAHVLVGTSHKRFLSDLTPDAATPDDRLEGSLATVAWAFAHGVTSVRVHDVAATVEIRELFARDVAEVGV